MQERRDVVPIIQQEVKPIAREQKTVQLPQSGEILIPLNYREMVSNGG